ncbi:hypothetical protein TM102_13600 [Bradyrhizobium sp. TM102]|nr:hypothetical protein TM102_13600 [Bradyrhizobium sp. TM102]
MNDEFVTLVGQHEIETRALEFAVEDQAGVGNNERALRHVTMRLRRKGIDMTARGRTGTLAVQGNRGVKLASVVQPGTVKRVKI